MTMKANRTEIQQQLQHFLLDEAWIESVEEFDLNNSFREDLKFTNRELQEMFFMTENEFDIFISAQDEQETETIGELVDLIVEKKSW